MLPMQLEVNLTAILIYSIKDDLLVHNVLVDATERDLLFWLALNCLIMIIIVIVVLLIRSRRFNKKIISV